MAVWAIPFHGPGLFFLTGSIRNSANKRDRIMGTGGYKGENEGITVVQILDSGRGFRSILVLDARGVSGMQDSGTRAWRSLVSYSINLQALNRWADLRQACWTLERRRE
jgi:hypothetical protein